MHHKAMWWPGWLVGLLVLGLVPAALAADDAARQVRQSALETVERWANRDFKLPPQLVLDASLRKEAEAMAAEHLARLSTLASAWADDELPHVDVRASPYALATPLVARYLNELALWQLDTTGDAYDRLMLRSLHDPGLCPAQAEQPAFAAVIAAAQRMAPADREAVLAAQRLLLARWGQQRDVPERPVPSLRERARSALQTLRGIDRPTHEPPVPPALAWNQLSPPADETPGRAIVCAMVRWALQRAPARSTPPAEQMVLARYAFVFDAGAALREPSEAQASADSYPRVAQRFGVEGEVVVAGRQRVDKPGLDAASVVARSIVVPGIRGVRPVAFETVFDNASKERAATLAPMKQVPAEESKISIKWKLE